MSSDAVPVSLSDILFDTLGVIQIGHTISLILFGVATAQLYYYYQNYSDDQLGFKLVVGAIWFNALALIACNSYGIILFVIAPPGSFETTRPVGYLSALIPSRVLEFLIQGLYSYRVWKFSGNAIIPIFSTILSLFAVFCAIFVLIQTFMTASKPILLLDAENAWPMVSIYITNAVVAFLIAVTMVYYLVKRREHGYKTKTKRQIDRLVVWTLQSGLIPSMLSVAGLICFLAVPNIQIYTLLLIITPLLSTNGLYALLNDRRQLRDISEHGLSNLDFDVPPRHRDCDCQRNHLHHEESQLSLTESATTYPPPQLVTISQTSSPPNRHGIKRLQIQPPTHPSIINIVPTAAAAGAEPSTATTSNSDYLPSPLQTRFTS